MKSPALAVTLILGLLPPIIAEQIGDYTYEVSGNAVTITDFAESEEGNITIPSEIEGHPVTKIADDAFANCGISQVGIPDTVTFIGAGAFSGCSNLLQVALPDQLTSIAPRTFHSCFNLETVIIPAGVGSIGDDAFRDCDFLWTVTFLGNAPALGENSFTGTASDLTAFYLDTASGFTSPMWEGLFCEQIDDETYPAADWLLEHGFSFDISLILDPNRDGIPLVTAYALGLNPHDSLQSRLPRPKVTGDSLTLTFWAAAAGVSYAVETSRDLDHWTTTGVAISDPDAEGMRTASVPRDSGQRFIRLLMSTNR